MRSGHSSPAFGMRVLTYVESLWLVSVSSDGRDRPQVQAIEEPSPVPLHSDTFSSTLYIISSVQSLSCAAPQASLSITNSQSLLKLMSIESVMPSNHLILCRPLLLPPSIFSSIRVFSNESVLHIRWPKHWKFSFNISPSSEHLGLISFRMDGWISLQSKGLSRMFSNTTVQKHQFFGAQLSL